ncbi:hypothetical protein GF325_18820 [Candidatus Bathyarchaeota archaeon]|nr:hypothetical protein [Candidatus Bathyarchaeota archaeon]
MHMQRETSASAPGRICLFGEHQDYLNLAVIPSAINLRTSIEIIRTTQEGGKIKIHALDLDEIFTFDLSNLSGFKDDDVGYFKAGTKVMMDEGYMNEDLSLEVSVKSEIPIKSGLSSSAALLVSWIQVLSKAAGSSLSPPEIGMLAYRAEHDVMEIPCGMMDQLSSAIGGIFHLQCTTPPVIDPLDARLKGLIVADTRVRKSTSQVHGTRVKETLEGLNHLQTLMDLDISVTPFSEIEPNLKELDDIEHDRLVAVFMNRDITSKAYRLLKEKPRDYSKIGTLLTDHQKYLRDYFEVSIEKIDRILEVGIESGALGGKLTGAGLGGSVILLAPGHEKEVCEAIREIDAIPYHVSVDRGVF